MKSDCVPRYKVTISIAVLLLLAPFVIRGISLANRTPGKGIREEGVDHPTAKAVVSPSPRLGQARRLAPVYGSLPLSFEPNEGQTDASVRYLAHGAGYAFFLTETEAVVSLEQEAKDTTFLQRLDAKTRRKLEARKIGRVLARIGHHPRNRIARIAIDGTNPNVVLEPLNELPGKSNYFIGNDPIKWRTGIPHYARIRYKGVYPGVDLIFYGNRRQLEFDFVVSPGADPNMIALKFGGHEHLRIISDGSLRLGPREDAVLLRRPSIYQVENGRKRPVQGRFVLLSDGRVKIRVDPYNHSEPLIMDPVLAYSTYLGGSSGSDSEGIAVDSSGDAFVVGSTPSTDFPIINGYQSVGNTNYVSFVSKLNPTGTTLLYSTYLGGSSGDYGNGIAIDAAGNAYVTGYSFSSDFPIVNGFQAATNNSTNSNAFVARLDTTKTGSASLIYSTYLGGGGNASNQGIGDVGLGISVDSVGRAYVTGLTTSDTSVAPFPTTASAFQSSLSNSNGNAFLTAVDTTQVGAASLVYSTYLGGDGSGPFGDFGVGVAVDSIGDAYLVGQTTSDASGPFPTTSGAYQSSLNSTNGNVFVTEIATAQSGSQSLVYSTYLGGSANNLLGDYGSSITLDSSSKVYIAGDAVSTDFPVTAGAFQTTNSADGKAFVAKFDLSQSGTQSLVYSTLVGGMDNSSGDDDNGIAVDAVGDAFVVGQTSSTDFPTTADAFQSALKSGGWNAFLTEFSPDGSSVLYSTYIGGSSAFGDVAMSVALDPLGNSYIAGYTESSDFPTTAGAYQTTLQGAQSAFVTMLSSPTAVVSLQVNPQSPSLVSAGTQQFSAIATLNNGNTQDMTASATWTSSNTSVVTLSNLPLAQGFAVGLVTGTANVTATLGTVTANTTVTVIPAPPTPTIAAVSPTSGQAGTQVTVTGSGFGATQGQGYLWLGSTIGTIASWSDTQIVATVAPASTSGTVQVTQGGLQSNAVGFTVATATISSVTPTSGTVGTQVTITGSGFGATQGNGQVWLGTANGIVSSWSDTQVVATVASGSTSGTAQVLQGGVWSNSVAFAINTPVITSITPSTGVPGTSVTITGSGFGASQGSGNVWIGGTLAPVTAWSDTQLAATVGASAVTGIAKIQQNGNWSNAVTFTVPPAAGSGTPVTLVPNFISMVVGDTRSIQALNSSNQLVSGLTWTSSDTTILTLSTDDPPILTGVASGKVTIFAGNASADVTVYPGLALPFGTVQWSNPGDGSGVYNFIPAVPSSSGVDVFALEQSGNLQAMRTDGTVVWTTSLPTGGLYSVPFVQADFQGGVNVFTGNSINKVDGTTGQPYPAYVGSSSDDQTFGLGYPAIHTDGTIFTVDYQPSGAAMIVGINPLTGTAKFSVAAVNGVLRYENADSCGGGSAGSGTLDLFSFPNALAIAGDGYAYTTYMTEDLMSSEKAAQQPLPDQAYQEWGTLGQDLSAHNAGAAAADAAAVSGYTGQSGWQDSMDAALCVNSSDPNCQPDFNSAINIAKSVEWRFARLCNHSKTEVNRMHILRVGSDGSSSDTIAKEWNYSYQITYTGVPDSAYSSYHYTETQVGAFPDVAVPDMITNVDQGALFSWGASLPQYCPVSTEAGCTTQTVAPSGEFHLTTNTGSDVIWTVPGLDAAYYWNLPVQPVLQLQDGSFVGTAYTYPVQMLNFDQSGNIKWSVPNIRPWVATADGGLTDGIYIFDANGISTGQVPNSNYQALSWKAAYLVSTGSSIVSSATAFPDLLATYGAVSAGNLTGNGTAAVQNTIAVVWCSDTISGTCKNQFVGLPLTQNVLDLGFTYAPWASIPPANLSDFTADHPDWVAQIIGQAMGTLAKAYKGIPVIIEPVSFATPPCQNQSWLTCLLFWPTPAKPSYFEHMVFVIGNYCPSTVGSTPNGSSPSYICYQNVMGNAQLAEGSYDNNHLWQPLSPSYSAALTPTQQTQFSSIVKAIGIGIGNSTAHETGHQFSLPQMDCDRPPNQDYQGEPAGPPCPGNGVHDLFYEFWTGNGEPPYVDSSGAQDHYLYSGPPLTWTSQDAASLVQLFLKKN